LNVDNVQQLQSTSKKIKNAQPITVSCAEGDVGKVYPGIIDYETKKIQLEKVR